MSKPRKSAKFLEQAKQNAKVFVVLNHIQGLKELLMDLAGLVVPPGKSKDPNIKSVNFQLTQCIEHISLMCVQYNRPDQLLNILDVFPHTHHLWGQYPLSDAFELALAKENASILDILIPLQDPLEIAAHANDCLKNGKTEMFRKLWPSVKELYNSPLPHPDPTNLDPVEFIKQQQLRINMTFLKQQVEHFPFAICEALTNNLTQDTQLVQDMCEFTNPLLCFFYMLECKASSVSMPHVEKAIQDILRTPQHPNSDVLIFQISDKLWTYVSNQHISQHPKQHKALQKIILDPRLRHMFPLSQSQFDHTVISSSLEETPTASIAKPSLPKKM